MHTLPAEIPSSTSFSCLWGRSADEIYLGTSEGQVFRWNGSDAAAETTPGAVDPVRSICGDAQGKVYAVGENSLAMCRLPTGSWVSFPVIEARADDHFTGLALSPDGMSCHALMMTNPGFIGGGLGRIWKLDGATATLEVRGLSLSVAGYGDAPGLLVRTKSTRTGSNERYAIGAQGVMVTTKPLPDEFSLEQSGDLGGAAAWQSVGVPDTVNGDRREITLTRSQTRQFFRLRRSIMR